jgi:predicted ribosomally synthesized peptide with SipW-like signal peptide
MRARTNSVSKSQRPGKVRAILASGLVLGVGAAFTLAAWTDDEWVFGGAGPDGDTPGTKTYNIQQNTVAPFAEATWTHKDSPNGGALDFTMQAADLLPGETVYAPFQLRAKAGSGKLVATLAEARQATADPVIGPTNSTELYEALVYRAWIGLNPANCSSSGDKTAGTVLVEANEPLSQTSDVPITLAAGVSGAAGAPVNLCFAMTLPADASETLQGKNVVPLWRFTGVASQ